MSSLQISMTIPLVPITKKNSQRIVINRKTGRPFIVPSDKYKEYERDAGYFLKRKGELIEEPVNVQALYYMPTRRRVDLINLHEALHDILVHYEVLKDDDSRIIVSTDGSRVLYDKDHPRSEVIITPAKAWP